MDRRHGFHALPINQPRVFQNNPTLANVARSLYSVPHPAAPIARTVTRDYDETEARFWDFDFKLLDVTRPRQKRGRFGHVLNPNTIDYARWMHAFHRSVSRFVINPRMYVYIDLEESPTQCDVFMEFISRHPLFTVKIFGLAPRISTDHTPLNNYHVFDVEFVGDRRMTAILAHPFFVDIDGDRAIAIRVFSFIQTTYRKTLDGWLFQWPTKRA